jgi:RNA polymerase sigma factor (sigma-70 family)
MGDERCRKGKEAFEELFSRHNIGLLEFATNIVGSIDAEDMCQETWIRAYEGIGEFAPPENAASWLMQIAKNLAIDCLRKRKSRREISMSDPGIRLCGNYLEVERDKVIYLEDLAKAKVTLDYIKSTMRHLGLKAEV